MNWAISIYSQRRQNRVGTQCCDPVVDSDGAVYVTAFLYLDQPLSIFIVDSGCAGAFLR